jgi:signal transduction histidine kinase/DNA-binding response OmpR family regulator
MIDRLYRSGERIAAATDVQAVADVALAELCSLAGAEAGRAYVADREGTLHLTSVQGVDRTRLPPTLRPDEIPSGTAFTDGGRRLDVPLRAGGGCLGVITLTRVADRPFDDEESAAITHLAGHAALALANAVTSESAEREAAMRQAVLDATVDGIRLVDLEGRTILANASIERVTSEVFGLSGQQTLYERSQAIAPRLSDPDAFLAASAAMAADPERIAVDEFQLAESGRTFQRYSAPVRDGNGDLIGRIVVLREVTEQREAEQLKTELVATVSHELRTPLASILGFAELLAVRELDPETRKRYLRLIYSEAQRLTELINDFLDLQRIEEGRFALALEPFDLAALLREQAELFAGQSDRHRLQAEVPEARLEVLGERDRVAQVVANLLSNAIKYSPAGGPVKLAAAHNDGDVRITVTDSGLGIPRDQQPRIFTKFFRVDTSDTREIGGTGLGLSLCSEIVRAHGGRIGFESVEGAGSTFWFTLPVRQHAGRFGPVVLVVEDPAAGADTLADWLAAEGLAVEAVATGKDALPRAREIDPALVCLDVALSGQPDGWQLLTQLREDPATARIPIVVCTGGDGRHHAAMLGATDVLAKPFEPEELRTAVSRLLPAGGGVLVVDDDEAVRRLVYETLGEDGFELREAGDGEAALAEIERRRPDALVLDLMMPKVDGFAVLDRLQRDARTRLLPVIVLTAKRLSAEERGLLQQRAVALLEKSRYSPAELRRVVRRALGH